MGKKSNSLNLRGVQLLAIIKMAAYLYQSLFSRYSVGCFI